LPFTIPIILDPVPLAAAALAVIPPDFASRKK
jgi:hypothetical protein